MNFLVSLLECILYFFSSAKDKCDAALPFKWNKSFQIMMLPTVCECVYHALKCLIGRLSKGGSMCCCWAAQTGVCAGILNLFSLRSMSYGTATNPEKISRRGSENGKICFSTVLYFCLFVEFFPSNQVVNDLIAGWFGSWHIML